ncbi:hypothetical protein BpHYR1_042500 [Brachionus plicatilis]|uniref:Uncharacterized protein n=1 Tax=Brachionus plicatilis TaxID=10195 RepID=A0A3M7SXF9_BRAPC|nr:hypothetical protein BpHYR1_042500 [Brachionus plicatilis]
MVTCLHGHNWHVSSLSSLLGSLGGFLGVVDFCSLGEWTWPSMVELRFEELVWLKRLRKISTTERSRVLIGCIRLLFDVFLADFCGLVLKVTESTLSVLVDLRSQVFSAWPPSSSSSTVDVCDDLFIISGRHGFNCFIEYLRENRLTKRSDLFVRGYISSTRVKFKLKNSNPLLNSSKSTKPVCKNKLYKSQNSLI